MVNKRGIDLNNSLLIILGILYAYSGVTVFLLGWVRLIFAIPAVCLTAIGIRQYVKEQLEKRQNETALVLAWPTTIRCLLLLAVYFVINGHGAWYIQGLDWEKHWAVLNDLFTKNWPVYYHNEADHSMLTYYIGHYLVPALWGKWFGSLRAAAFAQFVYDFFGLCLAVLLLFRVSKIHQCWKAIISLLIFLLFAKPLIFERALYPIFVGSSEGIGNGPWWLSWHILIYFRSTWNALWDVSPQTIVPWIITPIFYEHYRDTKYYVLLTAPLLLCATFPLVGLATLMLGVFLIRLIRENKRLSLIRAAISIPNVCAFLGAAIIPLVYLLGNILSEKPGEAGFQWIHYGTEWGVYVSFCAGFLWYSLPMVSVQRKNTIFWLVNLQMLLFPLMKVGVWNDLCMDGCIPAMFLLITMLIQTLWQAVEDRKKEYAKTLIVVLVLCVALGAINPIECINESIRIGRQPGIDTLMNSPATLETFARRDETTGIDMAYNYYTYDYEKSVFYRIFSRR